MDLGILWISTGFFLASFGVALWGLRNRRQAPTPLRYGLMATGFAGQCGFLAIRGNELERCPLTNGFEILVFVSWATVLLYFVIGTPFRLSLLGFFTAPLVAGLQLLALLLPLDRRTDLGPTDFWLELHAAVSLLAYGAFALAFLAGIMFLLQDWQLKRGRLETLFYQLPAIHYLGRALQRLLLTGFTLLSVGIGSAFMMQRFPGVPKLALILLVWCGYGLVLLLHRVRGMGSRSSAIAAVLCFALPVMSYWVLTRSSL
ncbi:MAG TPA: cytochrome c biogenesis protein CcsA [Verrucomicrobiales bacterium]|nr:cytochrome c biogenesis protein CcsA [Verrucomicrobiales bacterium]